VSSFGFRPRNHKLNIISKAILIMWPAGFIIPTVSHHQRSFPSSFHNVPSLLFCISFLWAPWTVCLMFLMTIFRQFIFPATHLFYADPFFDAHHQSWLALSWSYEGWKPNHLNDTIIGAAMCSNLQLESGHNFTIVVDFLLLVLICCQPPLLSEISASGSHF
jgi:hypothetical protein